MKYSILSLFFLLILLTSCRQGKDTSTYHPDAETIHVNLDDAVPLYMSDYFEEIEYIHLESPENRLIGRIRKFLIQDSRLGFYDDARGSIWIYTHDGEYVNEVVIPRGRGPGELENIFDIILTDDGDVHALGARKIVAYDLEGEFLHETPFNFWIYKFTYNSDLEEYIGYTLNSLNRGLANEHVAHIIFYFDKSGTITNSYLPIPTGREEFGYFATNKFPGFQDHQLFYPNLVDTVYSFGQDGPAPKYILDYGEHAIPENVFDRRSNYPLTPDGRIQFFEDEIEAKGYVNFMTLFNETNHYVHFWIQAGRNQHTIIYNKKTKETDVGTRLFINDMDHSFVAFMYDSSDDALYTVIEANNFLRNLNEVYEHEPEKYNSDQMRHLVHLGQQLSDNSNPILQIATFKTGEK